MGTGLVYITTPPRPPAGEDGLDRAFELVGADVFARYQRSCGCEVRLAVASSRPETPQELAALGVDPDIVTRTGDAQHERSVKAVFLKLLRQEAVEKRAGEGYVLRVGRYRQALLEHVQAHSEFIHPAARRDEVLALLREADAAEPCLTVPSGSGGLAAPNAPDCELAPWFGALTSYLSGAGYLDDPLAFDHWWPPAVQIVASDSLLVHAVAWPAMLMALDLPLPRRLVLRGAVSGGPGWSAAGLSPDALRLAVLTGADYLVGGEWSPSSPTWEGLVGVLMAMAGSVGWVDQGVGPAPQPLGAAERRLVRRASALAEEVGRLIEEFDFRAALSRVAEVVALLGAAAPGETPGPEVVAQVVRLLALSLQPFAPGLAAMAGGGG